MRYHQSHSGLTGRALDGTDLATFPEGCPAEFNDFEYSQREQTTAELRELIAEEAGRWH